jgi:hypothetical protein
MPYEIFGIPALICFAYGFYKGLQAKSKDN